MKSSLNFYKNRKLIFYLSGRHVKSCLICGGTLLWLSKLRSYLPLCGLTTFPPQIPWLFQVRSELLPVIVNKSRAMFWCHFSIEWLDECTWILSLIHYYSVEEYVKHKSRGDNYFGVVDFMIVLAVWVNVKLMKIMRRILFLIQTMSFTLMTSCSQVILILPDVWVS